MKPEEYLEIARAPKGCSPWKSGNYNICRRMGVTYLSHVCMEGLHMVDSNGFGGYTVMSDNDGELMRHYQAFRAAKGKVLKTGLGLGCFVRACLAKDEVEQIDVVEINLDLLDHIGAEFTDPRVRLFHADALEWEPKSQYDLAWHDIYCDGNHGLTIKHMHLIERYRSVSTRSGAWAVPKWVSRRWYNITGERLVGS